MPSIFLPETASPVLSSNLSTDDVDYASSSHGLGSAGRCGLCALHLGAAKLLCTRNQYLLNALNPSRAAVGSRRLRNEFWRCMNNAGMIPVLVQAQVATAALQVTTQGASGAAIPMPASPRQISSPAWNRLQHTSSTKGRIDALLRRQPFPLPGRFWEAVDEGS